MGGWLQLGGSQRGGNPAQFRKARKHLGLFVGGQAPLRATLPSSESDGFVCCSKAAETARSELIFLDPHGRARIVGPDQVAGDDQLYRGQVVEQHRPTDRQFDFVALTQVGLSSKQHAPAADIDCSTRPGR